MNTKITENFPTFLFETIDNVKKHLDQVQGDARRMVSGTWSNLGIDSITDASYKAFRSIGLATLLDLQAVEKKIDELRADVNKLSAEKRSPARPRKPKNV